MAKLSKFFLQPGEFLNESLWSRQEDFEGMQGVDNLFVVTNLGQLAQVQALIQFEQLQNNYLLILHTDANKRMPVFITKIIDTSLFTGHALLWLPHSPNKLVLKKLVYMDRMYKKVLLAIRPKTVFLLSFERHYALLAARASSWGCKLALVEEGTGTYKLDQVQLRPATVFSDGLNRAERLSVCCIQALPMLRRYRSALSPFLHYDDVYVAFPDLAKKVFKSNRFHRFFLHAGGMTADARTKRLVRKYQISSADFVYVNQRYRIDEAEHAASVLTILSRIAEMLSCRVFVKMHPKDTPQFHEAFRAQIEQRAFQDRIIYISEPDFLIEPTIAAARPRGIIGIASTSLVYAPLVSKSIRVYSIAPTFLSMVSSGGNAGKRAASCALISRHLEILKKFKHVVVLPHAFTAADLTGNTTDRRCADEVRHPVHAPADKVESNNCMWADEDKKTEHKFAEEIGDTVRTHVDEHGHAGITYNDGEELIEGTFLDGDAHTSHTSHTDNADNANNAENDSDSLLATARISATRQQWQKASCYFSWAFPEGYAELPPPIAAEVFTVLVMQERYDAALEVWGAAISRHCCAEVRVQATVTARIPSDNNAYTSCRLPADASANLNGNSNVRAGMQRSENSAGGAEQPAPLTLSDSRLINAARLALTYLGTTLSGRQGWKLHTDIGYIFSLNSQNSPNNLNGVNGLYRPQDGVALQQARVRLAIWDEDWRTALNALNALNALDACSGPHVDEQPVLIQKLMCLAEMGRHDDAVQLFQTSNSAGLSTAVVVMAQAWINAAAAQWTKVAAELGSNLAQFSDDERRTLAPDVLLARAYRMLKDFLSAKTYLDAAKAYCEHCPLLQKEHALLARDEKRWEDLAAMLEVAYSIDTMEMPTWAVVAYSMSLRKQGLIEQALSFWGDCTAHEYLKPAAQLEFAALKMQTGCWQSAIRIAQPFQAQSDDAPWVLAAAYLMGGHIDDAYAVLTADTTRAAITQEELELQAHIAQLTGHWQMAANAWHTMLCQFAGSAPPYAWDRLLALNTLLANHEKPILTH
ncbi:hypothetical protein H0A71_22725 [Alcaligenaceae bacterium]|nr:hypothetical protein [Alcaligenaceae bacterium]